MTAYLLEVVSGTNLALASESYLPVLQEARYLDSPYEVLWSYTRIHSLAGETR